MELSVYKIDGSESGKKVVLNEEIFGKNGFSKIIENTIP